MSTPRAQPPCSLHAISPRLLHGSFPPNSVVIVIIIICVTSTPCERRFFFGGVRCRFRVIRVLSSRYAHTSERIVIGIFGTGIGARLVVVGRSGLSVQGDYAAPTFCHAPPPRLNCEIDIPRLNVELKEALDLNIYVHFVRSATVYITVIVWRRFFGVRRPLIAKTARPIWRLR